MLRCCATADSSAVSCSRICASVFSASSCLSNQRKAVNCAFNKRSSSRKTLYFSAVFAWRFKRANCFSNSSRKSLKRSKFSRVCLIRFSVSRRRSLYFEMPAASSKNTRSSSGLASIKREIVPCSMMA